MVNKGKVIGIGLAALLGLTGIRSCSMVPAGHVKVSDTFGSVSQQELYPGLRWPVNPLSGRKKTDIRTKERKETMEVPTKEGLIATLDISLIYHVMPNKADEVYKSVGRNYEEVIVVPNFRNAARDVISGYSSDDLYNPSRQLMANDIVERLRPIYQDRGFELEAVLLRGVKLPPEVTNAIERKIGAKQEAEQMQYTLQKEKQEAERKRVEAKGIADAQEIIARSLTPEYLQWRYITTLESLAKSPNNTFVITPYSNNLLPMIQLNK